MNKRYQVFLSSTYADLKDERQKVIQTLMEMDCIPSGMELFPAMDEEQFEFIKKIIDDCDYYILIIGGRYGSVTNEGISYTQLEYEYAIQKGLKVLAFLHTNPDEIPSGKTDKDPSLLQKLNTFREEVETNRLVKYWNAAEELPGLVSLSLSKTIKTYPAVGWIRASEATNTKLLEELNALRKELAEVTKRNKQLEVNELDPANEDIAKMDEIITVHGNYKTSYQGYSHEWSEKLSWTDIFTYISPYLLESPNEKLVNSKLTEVILERKKNISIYNGGINEDLFQSIKIQLMAYKLIEVKYLQTTTKSMALFWLLTPKGNAMMIKFRSTKSSEKTVSIS